MVQLLMLNLSSFLDHRPFTAPVYISQMHPEVGKRTDCRGKTVRSEVDIFVRPPSQERGGNGHPRPEGHPQSERKGRRPSDSCTLLETTPFD